MASSVEELRRHPERGSDERELLDALLDEVIVGVLSTVVEGEPWSVPMLFARDGDVVLMHGSTGAGLLRHAGAGARVTLTVYSIDALVVGPTTFNSSANYRSAVLRGTLCEVPAERKDDALQVLSNSFLPGRTGEVRPSTRKELAATTVLELPIEDGTWLYKARTGPVGGDDAECEGVWVGLLPLAMQAGEPLCDPRVPATHPVPPSVVAAQTRWPGPTP